MGIGDLRKFLFWCTLMNFVLLAAWFAMFSLAGDWVFQLHGIWFDLDRQTFDAIHYAGIGLYKMLVIVFNAIPLLALLIMDRQGRGGSGAAGK